MGPADGKSGTGQHMKNKWREEESLREVGTINMRTMAPRRSDDERNRKVSPPLARSVIRAGWKGHAQKPFEGRERKEVSLLLD